MKQAAVELSSAGGPFVIREGLCGLISAASFSSLSPPAPSAQGCQHPAGTRRAIAVPRPCAEVGPQGQPQSLPGLESQPGGWGGELGGGFGLRERQNPPQALSALPCVEDSCPRGPLALEVSHTGSLDLGKLPSSEEEFSL